MYLEPCTYIINRKLTQTIWHLNLPAEINEQKESSCFSISATATCFHASKMVLKVNKKARSLDRILAHVYV